MKIETVTFRRVRNLGNYESKTLEFTAGVEEGDVVDEVIRHLMNLTETHLYLEKSPEIDGF